MRQRVRLTPPALPNPTREVAAVSPGRGIGVTTFFHENENEMRQKAEQTDFKSKLRDRLYFSGRLEHNVQPHT